MAYPRVGAWYRFKNDGVPPPRIWKATRVSDRYVDIDSTDGRQSMWGASTFELEFDEVPAPDAPQATP